MIPEEKLTSAAPENDKFSVFVSFFSGSVREEELREFTVRLTLTQWG